jgi:hypothetical protein
MPEISMKRFCIYYRKGMTCTAIYFALACMGCASRTDHVNVFDRSIPWSSPTSKAQNRMMVVLPKEDPSANGGFRSALWDTGDKPKLAAIENSHVLLFGAWWLVAIVDKDGQIEKEGRLECEIDAIPYCLLEVKTDSRLVPLEYRNRWILAVGLISKYTKSLFDPKKPVRFYSFNGPDKPDKNFSWIDVEPVEWESEHKGIQLGLGILGQDKQAKCEVRFAERVMSPNMEKQFIINEK